jgi:hypothetical protein
LPKPAFPYSKSRNIEYDVVLSIPNRIAQVIADNKPHLLTRRRNMISDLSGDEAKKSLEELISQSTKVEAWYVGNGIDAAVVGVLRQNPDGQYCVSETEISGPHISINPHNFSAGKFADKASTPDFSPAGILTTSEPFASALMFKLKDGSLFTVFEIAKTN